MKHSVIIPRASLAVCAKAASRIVDKNRSSPVLEGILLRIDGSDFIMAATDGRKLIEYVWEGCVEGMDGDQHQEWICNPQQLVTAAKSWNQSAKTCRSKPSVRIELETTSGGFQLTAEGISRTIRTRDGNYPAYRAALLDQHTRQEDAQPLIGLDARFLTDVCAAMIAPMPKNQAAVTMNQNGARRGIVFRTLMPTIPRATGLLMPVTLPQ